MFEPIAKTSGFAKRSVKSPKTAETLFCKLFGQKKTGTPNKKHQKDQVHTPKPKATATRYINLFNKHQTTETTSLASASSASFLALCKGGPVHHPLHRVFLNDSHTIWEKTFCASGWDTKKLPTFDLGREGSFIPKTQPPNQKIAFQFRSLDGLVEILLSKHLLDSSTLYEDPLGPSSAAHSNGFLVGCLSRPAPLGTTRCVELPGVCVVLTGLWWLANRCCMVFLSRCDRMQDAICELFRKLLEAA